MTTSPVGSKLPPATHRSGWFATAVATTFAALVLTAVCWWTLGLGPVGLVIPVAAALAVAVTAGRRGRATLAAYLGGTVAALASGYLALLAMAGIYAAVVQA